MTPASTFAFDVHVTVKNDGLTLDTPRDQLAAILEAGLLDGLHELPWVLDVDVKAI